MTSSSLRFVLALSALSCIACQPRTPTARPPTEHEASPEQSVQASAPAELRIFAEPAEPAVNGATPAASRFFLLGRDPSDSGYRTLSASLPRAAASFVPRAAHMAWLAGQVFLARLSSPTATNGAASSDDVMSFALHISPRPSEPKDAPAGEAAVRSVAVPLPQPCTQAAPALLQSEGEHLHALLRCPKEGYALLLTLNAQAQLQSSRRVPAAADASLYLHQPDGDYLAVARQVLRVPKGSEDTLPIIGTVPPPGGESETRDLIRSGDLLLIVDAAAGRVIVMDAQRMGWRTEKRFYTQGTVTRARSVLLPPDRLLLVTAEDTRQGSELFATRIVLSDTSAQPPQRLLLGPLTRGDHELLPVADSDGGGALLLYSRKEGSSTALVMRRLMP